MLDAETSLVVYAITGYDVSDHCINILFQTLTMIVSSLNLHILYGPPKKTFYHFEYL